VFAALAEDAKAIGAHVAAIERCGLGDPAAGADEKVDERPITEIAQAIDGEGSEQTGHGLRGDRMGIADDTHFSITGAQAVAHEVAAALVPLIEEA
jgi:lysophospholipase L1-like esterase